MGRKENDIDNLDLNLDTDFNLDLDLDENKRPSFSAINFSLL